MRSGGRGGGVSSASGTGTGAAGAEVCRAAAARRHGWWDGLPRWACNLLCALPYGRSLSATASKAAKKRGSVAANHGRIVNRGGHGMCRENSSSDRSAADLENCKRRAP